MRELIGKIKQEMEDFTLSPQAITEFIEKIEELQQQESPIVRIICEDDIQVLKLARLFILKLLNADSSQIQITGDDWKQENIDFSLIKFWIDDFELNRIISYKLYALGGHAVFNLVRQRDLLSYVYDEIYAVINNLRLGTESAEKKDEIVVTDLTEQIQENRESHIINSLMGEVQVPPQNGKCVKFTCTSREAENAKEVYVAGEFNNWLRPKGSLIRPSSKDQEMYGLQRQILGGKEIWEKDILVSLGHYDFKFVVGRRHWIH